MGDSLSACITDDDNDKEHRRDIMNTETKIEDDDDESNDRFDDCVLGFGASDHVGIFYDAYMHSRFQSAIAKQEMHAKDENVNSSDNASASAAKKQDLAAVTIQYWSLVTKVCRGDGKLTEPEVAYIRKQCTSLGMTEQDIEQALKGETNIEDYPFDENNPWSEFESNADEFGHSKTLNKEHVFNYLLVTCIVAAAQDGLSQQELDVMHGFADSLNMDRKLVDRHLETFKMEQQLFRRFKKTV